MRHTLPTRVPARRRAVIAGLTVAVTALVTPLVGAMPASATTYPSWADVQAAQANEAAKQAEIGTVEAALQSAQADAAAKSSAALTAAAAASKAEAELTSATQTADQLNAQADAAAQTAERAKTRAGQLAANLYRDGSGSDVTTRIAASKDPKNLLYQLGTLDQLSSTWAGVMSDATVAANTATALHDQATRAEAERARLATAAESKSKAADTAEAAANQIVASTQQHTTTLYAQLASLKNTTAQEEQQYSVGQAVAAQAAAQAAAAEAAANAGHGGSASSYPDPTGVVVNTAAAKAYAASAIGAYGWGSDQYSCLVSLWTQESGWRANALNSSSGAYGIPQALPASKMAMAGADWRTNASTQINWGLAYIKSAYGSPCGAWNHEMSVNPHWY